MNSLYRKTMAKKVVKKKTTRKVVKKTTKKKGGGEKTRGSDTARMAAKKVLERLAKGERVNKGEILRELGYSESTANKPSIVTDTKSFQEAISPVINEMEEIRKNAMDALKVKDLNKEKAKDLAKVIDTMTKNIELLSGRPTERNDDYVDPETKEFLDRLLKQ